MEGEDSKPPPKRAVLNTQGWDGKLRVGRGDRSSGPNEPSPPPSDNEGADEGADEEQVNGGVVEADEDLLDDVPEDETDIDLNHCRISSISALRLERFPKIERMCLRQNAISQIAFPPDWGKDHLEDLDLYDNAIAHIKGLDSLVNLSILDLSFNKIKHIKRIDHLAKLKELYLVQNKIQTIEALDGLTELRNLELGANRIRDIENLNTLTNLEQLWLGKNKITEIKNLDHLKNLNLLSIQANRLTAPSLAHLSGLPLLAELYLSHNLIDNIEPLSNCLALRTLDISSNPVSSLKGLKPLTLLEELWASDCNLESFEEVEEQLKDKKELTTVYFEGNPLQKRQPALYRNKIRLALPQVKQIDATYVRVE